MSRIDAPYIDQSGRYPTGCESVSAFSQIPEAYEEAVKNKGEEGMLFCAGSLYLVGEIKTYLQSQKQ